MSASIDLTAPWTGAVDIDSVVPNPEQPRKYFDEAKLALTAKSVGERQVSPIGVIAHRDPKQPGVRWMIVDGERRWRGLKAIGAKKIKIAYDPEITREILFAASLAANFCREGHTKEEVVHAIGRLRDAGMSQREIGERLGRTDVWVSDYCIIRSLQPDLLRAMDFPPEGGRKLSLNIAKLLAPLRPLEQIRQWDKIKALPSAEAFHKLRCSGTVRGARRSPVEDVIYVQAQAGAALQKIEAMVNIPLPMLKRLSPDNIAEVKRTLAKIGEALEAAGRRLEISQEGGD